MNYTTCPICNDIDLVKEEESILCNQCGYHTTPRYKDLSKTYITSPKTPFDFYMLSQPIVVKETIYYDDDEKLFWLPIIINMYPKYSIFPHGTQNEVYWGFAKYLPIPIMQRVNYPIPGKKGEYHEYRLDLENIISFDTFKEVVEYLK